MTHHSDDVRYVRNSETEVWRDCRLKWYFSYYLGFLSEGINPNFWLGTFVHYALSEWYMGRTPHPAHLFWTISEDWLEANRSASIAIDGDDLEYDEWAEIRKYQDLGISMLEGYVAWAQEHDDFDVIDSELAYWLELEDHRGFPFVFVCRFDLLTENSEGIRVRDFKTASDFRDRAVVRTYQQFRRYPWVVTQAHPDWADDVVGSAWVGLRKVIPSARSKPPYFATELIDLSPEELAASGQELITDVTQILVVEEQLQQGAEPRVMINPNPNFNCSWKCTFYKNGLCELWRTGAEDDEISAAGLLHGSWGNDPYAEYKEDEPGSVLAIGRREGGDD